MSELGLGKLTIDPKTNSPRMTSIGSDIDTEQLTQSLYEAKRLPAVRIEQKISVNDAKEEAYGELRTKLRDVKNALDGLRNPSGFDRLDKNLFENKAAYFSSDTPTSPASLLGVQADNRADVGSFDLTIDALASAHKTMSQSFASADEQLGPAAAGTLTVGLGSGDTADVAVAADMNVHDLRDAINAEAETTDVRASVLKVADADYRLVLSGERTGAANEIALGGPGALTTKLQDQELAGASDARLQVDGVTVVRPDNTIDDLMDGLTLDLYQAEPATTVTVEIEPDFSEAKEAVQSFVDAYNGLRDFIDGQRQVSEDGAVDELESPLFGDSLLRRLGQELGAVVGDAVTGLTADAPRTLAEIGISMGEGGRLSLDQAALDENLIADPGAVRDVFEFRAESSDPALAIYRAPNELPATDFEVEKLGDGSWELRDGTRTVTLAQDGSTLTAPDDSAYAGLTMFWTDGDDPAGPVTVEASAGLAHRLHATIDDAVTGDAAPLSAAIDETEQQSKRWRDDIDTIERRAEDYRLMLVDKFARLETALSLSESMLTQVRAQTDAMTADS
jgi:flagellar hook-associated protein 2